MRSHWARHKSHVQFSLFPRYMWLLWRNWTWLKACVVRVTHSSIGFSLLSTISLLGLRYLNHIFFKIRFWADQQKPGHGQTSDQNTSARHTSRTLDTIALLLMLGPFHGYKKACIYNVLNGYCEMQCRWKDVYKFCTIRGSLVLLLRKWLFNGFIMMYSYDWV